MSIANAYACRSIEAILTLSQLAFSKSQPAGILKRCLWDWSSLSQSVLVTSPRLARWSTTGGSTRHMQRIPLEHQHPRRTLTLRLIKVCWWHCFKCTQSSTRALWGMPCSSLITTLKADSQVRWETKRRWWWTTWRNKLMGWNSSKWTWGSEQQGSPRQPWGSLIGWSSFWMPTRKRQRSRSLWRQRRSWGHWGGASCHHHHHHHHHPQRPHLWWLHLREACRSAFIVYISSLRALSLTKLPDHPHFLHISFVELQHGMVFEMHMFPPSKCQSVFEIEACRSAFIVYISSLRALSLTKLPDHPHFLHIIFVELQHGMVFKMHMFLPSKCQSVFEIFVRYSFCRKSCIFVFSWPLQTLEATLSISVSYLIPKFYLHLSFIEFQKQMPWHGLLSCIFS